MNINETFQSFQGEGPNTGKPSIFLRLSGCNLKCVYCDTKYTWLFTEKTLDNIREMIPLEVHEKLGDVYYNKENETHQMTINELIEKFEEYSAKNIVITGGEPLLQKKEINKLISHPYFKDYTFEIETNGTIEPLDIQITNLQYNVSPKLSNSFNKVETRYKPSILQKFSLENSVFKFVITELNDIEEINKIREEVKIPKSKVYLMPEAASDEELANKGKYIAELAIAHNFNYSHRLHIQFYGDKRGV